ncbi:MAG: DUF692 family multinuclear iron-containing protein [Actinomycetota bacterium]
MSAQARRIGLGFSYNGRHPSLFAEIAPFVDYVEVTPDSIATTDGGQARIVPDALAELRDIASAVEVVVHGVGLSIGSHDAMSQRYIRLLDEILEQIPARWHSEHLGYVNVDGANLGTMVAVPRTSEALELIVERVVWILDRYGIPFLLENVVHVLPERSPELDDAAFLNRLVSETGCGILLDAYNLECDAHNNGFDSEAFLQELDLSAVREVHVAGGVAHDEFLLDIHSRPVAQSTIDLARDVLSTADSVDLVTFELLDEAIPMWGEETIARELGRLRHALVDAQE